MIYKTITNYKEATKDFLENEKQFHLGVIPTEQSNPLTKNLSATIAKDTAQGVKLFYQQINILQKLQVNNLKRQNLKHLYLISKDVWMREKKWFFQVLVHQEEWQFKWMVLGELSGKD